MEQLVDDSRKNAAGKRSQKEDPVLGDRCGFALDSLDKSRAESPGGVDGSPGEGNAEQVDERQRQADHKTCDLAVFLLEHAEIMLPLQPCHLRLGSGNQRCQGNQQYGQGVSHLLLGDDCALDAQGRGALLAVGLDLDALLEGSGTADWAVGHFDFTLLAWFDGLGGVFGARATARRCGVDDEQRFVARVGEFKGTAHGTVSFLNGAEVMALYLECCLGKILVSHAAQDYRADGKKHYQKSFGHCLGLLYFCLTCKVRNIFCENV